jgi:hypothetical protein
MTISYDTAIAAIEDLQGVISELQDELLLARGGMTRLAWLAIGNAETEAELGCVTQSTYDSMLDIYYMFKGDNAMRQDVLAARKAMRQNEWGIEFPAEEFDLPLDPEWLED